MGVKEGPALTARAATLKMVPAQGTYNFLQNQEDSIKRAIMRGYCTGCLPGGRIGLGAHPRDRAGEIGKFRKTARTSARGCQTDLPQEPWSNHIQLVENKGQLSGFNLDGRTSALSAAAEDH